MKTALDDKKVEALWHRAEAAGMSRRKFLILLATSGAAAVLTACSPRITTTTTTATKTTTATTTITPTPTPLPLIIEPTPAEYFIPLGSNAEMRFEVMANRTYNMPNSVFFVRDHTFTPFPPIDIKTWSLSVSGDGVANPITLTYDDLLAMPATTVTRYVECAGNGRSFFSSLLNNPAQGGQWHLGAYGIADWTGVKLSDILNRAGIKSNAVDVMPAGFDSLNVRRPMPVSKAMEADTIVAYMMNGDILPIDHGFPARVLTPGWVGVSNIKWVNKITVSTTPQFSDWNTSLYILIGPDYQPQGQQLGPPVNTQVMKSALCLPFPATLSAGQQKVTGYAWSPAGKIAKVDVSLDNGNTFQPANLTGSNIERAGSRWEFSFNAAPGSMTITPRATDDQGNVQYPVSQQKWNQQGYLFGAMVPHPVTVK
ncbi:MAG TPA: sulfite oxidase [Dehalococcoidales bacterium]|nr:sulfite oxidase [Dehalococcoidales bacterium]